MAGRRHKSVIDWNEKTVETVFSGILSYLKGEGQHVAASSLARLAGMETATPRYANDKYHALGREVGALFRMAATNQQYMNVLVPYGDADLGRFIKGESASMMDEFSELPEELYNNGGAILSGIANALM